MSINLTKIKSYLGKFYSELSKSILSDKYVTANLDRFLEQRFYIQNNKMQMVIDPALSGLLAIVAGNEIHISKELYNHPYINITNSMENVDSSSNPHGLYTPVLFSSIAYLICQNHTMFHIVGEIEEPIYIRYVSDCETFYNSVVVFNIADSIEVEIVEEFNSNGALNAVTNYILHENTKLNLSTFCMSAMSASSFCLRNVIMQEYSSYSHALFGKGSSISVDESRITSANNATVELLGCIRSDQQEFHVIVGILPGTIDFNFMLDHRRVISGKGKATFTPLVYQPLPSDAHLNITSLALDEYSDAFKEEAADEFLSSLTERATLERFVGTQRFYSNKSKFLQF